jgi:hypothetical protein
MANPETVIQQEIRLEVQKAFATVRLFGNGQGRAFILTRPQLALLKKNGMNPTCVTYGLSVGSPDLIGWRTITITSHMVGKSFAQFVGCEVKTEAGIKRKGAHEKRQDKWIALINNMGGHAFKATSFEEAIQKLNPAQLGGMSGV